MTATLCKDCDNVAEHTRDKPQHQWLCLAFKRMQGGSFLDPDWKNDPPYNYCRNINVGHCPAFTPRRTEQIENGL